MPPRQLWLFKLGCWIAFLAAAVHLAGQLAGGLRPGNDTERQLLGLATTYRFAMPGGAERSLMDFIHGFGWSFALFAATMGAVGLVAASRGRTDGALARATARVLAAAGAMLCVISLVYFFLVPTAFLLAMTVCFGLASVRAPE